MKRFALNKTKPCAFSAVKHYFLLLNDDRFLHISLIFYFHDLLKIKAFYFHFRPDGKWRTEWSGGEKSCQYWRKISELEI